MGLTVGLNVACIGRRYPDTPPYEVTRRDLGAFAEAVGADGVNGRGPVGAALPTFAVVIAQPATRQASLDPDVGLDYTRVVHGEQRFVHHEPLRAGDVVTARVRIVDIRPAGANWKLTTETAIHRIADDTLVCSATSTLIERAGA